MFQANNKADSISENTWPSYGGRIFPTTRPINIALLRRGGVEMAKLQGAATECRPHIHFPAGGEKGTYSFTRSKSLKRSLRGPDKHCHRSPRVALDAVVFPKSKAGFFGPLGGGQIAKPDDFR